MADGDEDLTTIAVRGAIAGDEDALTRLLERFTPALMASARQRLTGQLRQHVDPEDLVQEVWAIALPRLGDLEPRHERFTPVLLRFLASTMWRCHAGLLRRHLRGRPRARLSDTQLSARGTGVVSRAARDEATTRLLAGLDQLSEAERETVVLRGLEQVPNGEVGLLLGEEPNTIAKRYGRALDKLRAIVPGSILEEL